MRSQSDAISLSARIFILTASCGLAIFHSVFELPRSERCAVQRDRILAYSVYVYMNYFWPRYLFNPFGVEL